AGGTWPAREAASSPGPQPPAPVRRRPLLVGSTGAVPDAGGGVRVQRTFDLTRDVYLADHRLDGRPVVPFALVLGRVTEVAEVAWPDRTVVAVRDMQVRRGIALDAGAEPDPVDVLVTARRMDSRADSRVDRTLAEAIVADVTVAAADEPSRVYYRARV